MSEPVESSRVLGLGWRTDEELDRLAERCSDDVRALVALEKRKRAKQAHIYHEAPELQPGDRLVLATVLAACAFLVLAATVAGSGSGF